MTNFRARRPALRMGTLLLAGVLCVAATGCFGSFNMTRNVYAMNRDISENRWAKSGTMIAFAAFQLYTIAAMMDISLFNTIEFWHRNPVKTFDATRTTPEGDVATFSGRADGSLVVRLERADGRIEEARLVQDDDAVVAYGAHGEVVARYPRAGR